MEENDEGALSLRKYFDGIENRVCRIVNFFDEFTETICCIKESYELKNISSILFYESS
jgi:hypothetical protein